MAVSTNVTPRHQHQAREGGLYIPGCNRGNFHTLILIHVCFLSPQEYVELLQSVSAILNEAGVEYIMCDGTLLGSFMCHGFLPWDDDADLMVNVNDMEKVNKVFRYANTFFRNIAN